MSDEMQVEQHFVEFFSPGTMFSETTEKRIESWDIKIALTMFGDIKERHGATPYGFQFITRGRRKEELDSSEIARGPMHYLGGKIYTLDEVKALNDPDNRILISNMEGNHHDKVIINKNSYKSTFPFNDDDILLEY